VVIIIEIAKTGEAWVTYQGIVNRPFKYLVGSSQPRKISNSRDVSKNYARRIGI
jgi:hypothetical protein